MTRARALGRSLYRIYTRSSSARRPRHVGAAGGTIDVCTWHVFAFPTKGSLKSRRLRRCSPGLGKE
jgi:hypothetical protein